MEKVKALDLIAGRILFMALNAHLPPPARLRFIKLMLEIYADAMVAEHIVTTLKVCKVKKESG